jgi:hypothetical protein
MIRAIHRWQVDPEPEGAFVSRWHQGTVRIRSSQTGAMGSTLLRTDSDQNQWVAIARCESVEALTTFWNDPGGPQLEGAALVSVEVLEEVDHLTFEHQ